MVERREITRTRVRRDVLIFKPDSVRAIDGTIRNLTTKGAGLSVPATPVGAPTFEMSFDSGRTMRACRLIWQRDDEIGVVFGRLERERP
jgi:bifunctional pyridoxal-dependent enzyme with beta-cystathionase and maltose regulon repressor activities